MWVITCGTLDACALFIGQRTTAKESLHLLSACRNAWLTMLARTVTLFLFTGTVDTQRIITTSLSKPIVHTADSPVECLNDLLCAEPGMPEGCVSQLLACKEEYRSQLKTLLKTYKDVFPTALPKHVPPNWGLGDEMEIRLQPETKLIWQKIYHQSSAKQLAIKK